MATLQELKRQIEDANALGLANLEEKGIGLVGVPGPGGIKSPTTYAIMSAIAEINVNGGESGIQYTSITFNDDDTIYLVDSEGNTHTMSYTYKDDMLDSVTYDGSRIRLGYDDDDNLIKVGATEVKGVINTRIAPSYPPTWFAFVGNVEPSGTVERVS
jgi:hypothetical protein